MSVVAGTLEIQLLAALSKLSTDMQGAVRIVQKNTGDIEKYAGKASSALQAIGVGLSLGGISLWAKGVMDSLAMMKDLAQEAGVTVEAISKFEAPARLAGTTLDSVAGAMFKMSKAAQEAKDPMSNAGQALAAIGISTAQLKSMTPDKLFETVARAIDKYGDGITKNAVMQELFGKSGREMARVIKEVADSSKLAATATFEQAEEADKLQDQMVVMQMNSEKLWRSMAGMGLPVMNDVLKAFIEGKQEAGLYEGAIRALTEIFDKIKGTGPAAELAKVTSELEMAERTAERLKDKPWWATFAEESMKSQAAQVEALRARKAQLEKEIHEAELRAQDARAIAGQKKKPPLAFDPEAMRKDADEAKRLREMDAKGWVAYIEALEKADEEALKAAGKLVDERRKIAEGALDSLKDYVEQVEFENAAVGMTNSQREISIRLRMLEKAGVDLSSDAVAEYVKRLREALAVQEGIAAEQEAARLQVSIWSEAGNALGGFLNAMTGGFKSAVDYTRQLLKRLLADLISIFAQRWVLQMGASLLGSTGAGSALASAAGTVGQGSLAGSLLSAGGGLLQSGLGSLLGGGTGGAVAASELLSMMSAAGPYIAAIAAVYALYSAFKDKGENWKGKLGFGANANAYTTTGPFGVQGFEYLAGDDATNRAIQSFMGSTIGIDRQLAARMTPAQIAAITGRLTGVYNTRNDGQPAEFAFGKGDDTAGQQLTLEFLQKKYGTIFDDIDSTFAEFIRGYTGKSEDLLKAIGEFAGLLDMLDASGIKGLNIATLRAFQKEGEELGATFARITQQYAQFQDLYYTDAEKIALVQDQVAGVFADLGISMPTTNEEFRKLVESLDLSTESGRKMFQALMGIAPAFNTITNAAAAAVTRFNSLAATLSPSFGAANARSVLEARVRTWMGLTPGNGAAGGWDVESTIGNIGTLVREGRIGEALTYAQSLGGNAVTVLNDMLEAYIAWTTAMQNAQGPVTTVSTAVSGLGDAAARAAAQMQGAKDGLWAYLQGLFVNPSLSPLGPEEQLREATRQFYEQLGLARGGDVGAASGLQGYIDRVLTLGRDGSGSGSAYIRLFREITSAAADFVKPGGADDLQRNIYQEARTGNDLARDIRQILLDIRDRGTADGEQVAGAVENAALSTAMR